jgi:hypothetical protein
MLTTSKKTATKTGNSQKMANLGYPAKWPPSDHQTVTMDTSPFSYMISPKKHL